MKAVSTEENVEIRNPNATRPWQHVLEPLSGYLQIGQKLLEGNIKFAEGWNLGPDDSEMITVKEVVENIQKHWSDIKYQLANTPSDLHEANLLKLDCSKAHAKLKWHSVWDCKKTFEATTKWYKNFYKNSKIDSIKDLQDYIKDAKAKDLAWTK